MATRKQKHEAAIAKRELRLSEQRESGLEAQRRDHEHRENRSRDMAREKHNKKHSWKKIDRECILCQDLIKNQSQKMKELEELSGG